MKIVPTSTSPIVTNFSSACSRSSREEVCSIRLVVPCRKEKEKEATSPLLKPPVSVHVILCFSNSATLKLAALCLYFRRQRYSKMRRGGRGNARQYVSRSFRRGPQHFMHKFCHLGLLAWRQAIVTCYDLPLQLHRLHATALKLTSTYKNLCSPAPYVLAIVSCWTSLSAAVIARPIRQVCVRRPPTLIALRNI